MSGGRLFHTKTDECLKVRDAVIYASSEMCLTLLFLRFIEISSRSEQKIYGYDLLAPPTYCSRLSRKQRSWQKDGSNWVNICY